LHTKISGRVFVIGQIFVSLAIVYFGHIIGEKTEAANIFGIFFSAVR
jgi:hypothetical protein